MLKKETEFICRIRLHLVLTKYLVLVFISDPAGLSWENLSYAKNKGGGKSWYLWTLIKRIFVSCMDGIDTEVAVCPIPWLLLAFEAEQNGCTTPKIGFVTIWLFCVHFKTNLQIFVYLSLYCIHGTLEMLNLFMEVTKWNTCEYR